MATRLLLPALLAYLVAAALFLTWGARGDWGFVLAFRGEKLAALTLVAAAVAISTIVFQTITANRILTPSIMGFDALYLLIQTGLVFALSGVGAVSLDPLVKFGAETALMLAAALALFSIVLRGAGDLNRMVLTGIIIGVVFRSVTGLMNRMMDPSEFTMIQSATFARFNAVDTRLLWIAALVTLAAAAALMARARELDVLSLGRDAAINLGVDHDRAAKRLLLLVSLLVSVSTALVGPVVFFGLLVSALTHRIAGTFRHDVLLPLSALLAAVILVASQTLFERVLGLQTSVSVVIEALGGIVFIYLILKRPVR
ncbi:iron chelate uptake ABC transporter family permease subunit [Roseicyclus sp. F158]|uniref:Iron chelate uptake ABC transporter family permease subunit n=1 Tax=Tropicimonas omnivorans TaxID=3075590 RepID=A0ABU3DFG4_9RHOB|nr:iron chelate uptake ABC transporter family permease subunit [Roseicyclus sp. F158]MDT0682456.1 iron chelate uptake ABC transporter family permease subunit [Roseicyclus sp. F158]